MDKKPKVRWSETHPTPPAAQTVTQSNHHDKSFLDVLRSVPRWGWLMISAMVLLAATIMWVRKAALIDGPLHASTQAERGPSSNWWTKVPVRRADAVLPEIAGRAFGVAIQKSTESTPERVWIVGAKGLLANTEDEGECWTLYGYDKAKGEFAPPKAHLCHSAPVLVWPKGSAALHWPNIIPSVLAGYEPQSSFGGQRKQQSNPPANSSAVQQKAPSNSTPQQSPANSPVSGPQQGGAPANSQSVGTNAQQTPSGSNAAGSQPTASPKQQSVPPTSNASQTKGESSAKSDSTAGSKPAGPVEPIADQSKQSVDTKSPSQGGKSPTKPIRAKEVVPATARSNGKPASTPVQRNAASEAPDLLAIDFTPDGTMVSTGGIVWMLSRDDAGVERWTARLNLPSGASGRTGGLAFVLASPNGEPYASETQVLDSMRVAPLRDDAGCTDCVTWQPIRGYRTDHNVADWSVGWSSDDSGDHAVVLRSHNSGGTWQPVTRGALSRQRRTDAAAGHPWRWMPPWYLAMLLVSVVLATPALLPPGGVTPIDPGEAAGSVEGRLSSDKPLAPGEYDALGITSIALGLSQFLRNEKTLPPLTIGINGEWGSGKSSLMNLLRCDLESYGMYPVWFNAWHHQKEEHLLAALLQTLRAEAVPPLRNLLGVPFRLRLLWYHFRRKWPLLVAIAAVLIFVIALDYQVRTAPEKSDLFVWLANQILPSLSAKSSPNVPTIPIQGGLIALITAIGILWKGLTAFGANPASLLASVAQGNKIKDLEEQTSFRQKFAVEFSDFTKALGPRRPLTIFIDDLDRCLPSNVRDVLEAVNFLVSSGDCFVVLGMDRLQVQRAVGLSFKDVAEESSSNEIREYWGAESGNGERREIPLVHAEDVKQAIAGSDENGTRQDYDTGEIARKKRAEFAQKYLEKLLNLEVRVPMAADDEIKRRLLVAPKQEDAPSREKVMQAGIKALQWAVPVALAVLLVLGGYQLSLGLAGLVEQSIRNSKNPTISSDTSRQSNSAAAQSTAGTSSSGASQASETKGASSGNRAQGASGEGQLVLPVAASSPTYVPGQDIWPARWLLSTPFYFVGIFVLLAANVALTTRPGVVTHDSKPFADALDQVWYPLVLARQNTPRTAKRFVNRLRYLAMRQRVSHEQASMWERALFPQRLREPSTTTDSVRIPEPFLVAMAAIEQLEPIWIYDDVAFQWLAEGDKPLVGYPGTNDANGALIEKARAKHLEAFRDKFAWSSISKYRDRFIKIWPRTDPTQHG